MKGGGASSDRVNNQIHSLHLIRSDLPSPGRNLPAGTVWRGLSGEYCPEHSPESAPIRITLTRRMVRFPPALHAMDVKVLWNTVGPEKQSDVHDVDEADLSDT